MITIKTDTTLVRHPRTTYLEVTVNYDLPLEPASDIEGVSGNLEFQKHVKIERKGKWKYRLVAHDFADAYINRNKVEKFVAKYALELADVYIGQAVARECHPKKQTGFNLLVEGYYAESIVIPRTVDILGFSDVVHMAWISYVGDMKPNFNLWYTDIDKSVTALHGWYLFIDPTESHQLT